MPDTILNLKHHNWIFGYVYYYKSQYQIAFTKNIHSDVNIVKYDEIFETIESIRTETKEEILDIYYQIEYQIKNDMI